MNIYEERIFFFVFLKIIFIDFFFLYRSFQKILTQKTITDILYSKYFWENLNIFEKKEKKKIKNFTNIAFYNY